MSDEETPNQPIPQPKLTPKIRSELITWLERGLPREVAARVAGTTDSTVRVWRAKSRQGVTGYKRFDDEVVRAMSLGESILLAQVRAAGKANWRAAAWLLERMYPERYAPPSASNFPDVPPHEGVPTASDDQAGL